MHILRNRREDVSMRQETRKELEQLLADYDVLEQVGSRIEQAFYLLKQCVDCKGMIYVCGNGGSAADSEHIVGELMKGFQRERSLLDEEKAAFERHYGKEGLWLADRLQHGIPAVSLVSQIGIATAFVNDVGAEAVFAQQVYGYGKKGDLLWAISTSGNSMNVVNAVRTAKVRQMKSIAMTGEQDSQLSVLADVCIQVPARRTARIQEYHLPIYHCLCAMLETEYYGGISETNTFSGI